MKELEDMFWGAFAPIYYRVMSRFWPHRELVQTAIDAAEVAEYHDVVDAGCGPGIFVVQVMKVLKSGNLTCIDWSPEMLGFARRMIEEERVALGGRFAGSVGLHNCDLNDPSWTDFLRVDHIFSINSLYTLNDPVGFVSQAFGALKPAGRLIIANPFNPDLAAVLNYHQWWLAERATREEQIADRQMAWAYRVFVTFNEIIKEAAEGQVLHFWSEEKMRAVLEQAGFRIVSLRNDLYAGTELLVVAERPL